MGEKLVEFQDWIKGTCEFKCCFCLTLFKTRMDFWDHIEGYHRVLMERYKKFDEHFLTKSGFFPCKLCEREILFEQGALVEHFQRDHGMNPELYFAKFVKPEESVKVIRETTVVIGNCLKEGCEKRNSSSTTKETRVDHETIRLKLDCNETIRLKLECLRDKMYVRLRRESWVALNDQQQQKPQRKFTEEEKEDDNINNDGDGENNWNFENEADGTEELTEADILESPIESQELIEKLDDSKLEQTDLETSEEEWKEKMDLSEIRSFHKVKASKELPKKILEPNLYSKDLEEGENSMEKLNTTIKEEFFSDETPETEDEIWHKIEESMDYVTMDSKLRFKVLNSECEICKFSGHKGSGSELNRHLVQRHTLNFLQYFRLLFDKGCFLRACLFKCRMCEGGEKTFITSNEAMLLKHLNEEHNTLSLRDHNKKFGRSFYLRSTFKCPECHKSFPMNKYFEVHWRTVHNMNMRGLKPRLIAQLMKTKLGTGFREAKREKSDPLEIKSPKRVRSERNSFDDTNSMHLDSTEVWEDTEHVARAEEEETYLVSEQDVEKNQGEQESAESELNDPSREKLGILKAENSNPPNLLIQETKPQEKSKKEQESSDKANFTQPKLDLIESQTRCKKELKTFNEEIGDLNRAEPARVQRKYKNVDFILDQCLYTCKICQFEDRNRIKFLDHVQSEHNIGFQEYHKEHGNPRTLDVQHDCALCGKKLKYDSQSIKFHLNIKHSTNVGDYMCLLQGLRSAEAN